MTRTTFGLVLGLLTLAAGAFLLCGTRSAAAEIEGSCDARFAGVDVALLDSNDTDDAIVVSEDDVVPVQFISATGFESHEVVVKFADIPGGSVTVEDEDDEGSLEWSDDVAVDDWAWAGAGLYKVEAEARLSDGTECFGAALIDVDKPFYETVAGLISLFLAVFGAGSVGIAGVASVMEGRGAIKRIDEWAAGELQKLSGGQTFTRPDRRTLFGEVVDAFCLFAVFPALILTGAAVATGSTPGQGLGLPRAVWRPRFSVSGIVGGVTGGIAIVALLQQSGRMFPNTVTLALWIGVGLLLGFVVPSLVRALNVTSINRAIARAERRLMDAGATPGQTATNPPRKGDSS